MQRSEYLTEKLVLFRYLLDHVTMEEVRETGDTDQTRNGQVDISLADLHAACRSHEVQTQTDLRCSLGWGVTHTARCRSGADSRWLNMRFIFLSREKVTHECFLYIKTFLSYANIFTNRREHHRCETSHPITPPRPPRVFHIELYPHGRHGRKP